MGDSVADLSGRRQQTLQPSRNFRISSRISVVCPGVPEFRNRIRKLTILYSNSRVFANFASNVHENLPGRKSAIASSR